MGLRGLRLDPSGLVTACRRIVDRHPTSGPLWSMCARVLTSPEPFSEAVLAADEIESDRTPEVLIDALPDAATVTVLGWPDLCGDALIRRGDPLVLVGDVHGEADPFVRRLDRSNVESAVVPLSGLAGAVGASDLVIIEAVATGPDAALCVAGSHAAAALAYCAEIPVWLVEGVGRRLADPLWRSLLERSAADRDPWELEDDVVPFALVSHLVGPGGVQEMAGAPDSTPCPMAPELLRLSPF